MKKRLMIATNLYQVDPVVYASHMNMMYRVGRNLPDVEVLFSAPWRMPIDKARDMAVKYALQNECTHLFFYDDDMRLDPLVVEKMFRRFDENPDMHILQARAFIRGFPYEPMIFKYVEKGVMKIFSDYEGSVRDDGLVKVDAVGCCCTMIDCELFKIVPEPWFVTGNTHTEDVYFCVKASEYVEDVGIYMDDLIEAGHLVDKPILTKASKQILLDIHEKYGLNQIWLPDIKFSKDIKYMADPTAPTEFRNPLEVLGEGGIGSEDCDTKVNGS